jgi:acetyl CoA:N6-hydroxylysine acetyl transferase
MIPNHQIVLIMPTKPDLLSPVRSGWNIFGNSCPVISMRPFSPDTDMPVIQKWINEDCGGQAFSGQEPDLLGDIYAGIAGSDAARIFIGMVDDSPICEIEMYKVRQHAISLAYEAQASDYYLDLLPAPATPQQHMSELLNNAMEYFFSFSEVGRIMAEADIRNEWTNRLLKSAGFHFYKRIRAPYKNSNLYFCTRRTRWS